MPKRPRGTLLALLITVLAAVTLVVGCWAVIARLIADPEAPVGAGVPAEAQVAVATLADTAIAYPQGNEAGLLPAKTVPFAEFAELVETVGPNGVAGWIAYNPQKLRVAVALGTPDRPSSILAAAVSDKDPRPLATVAQMGIPVRTVSSEQDFGLAAPASASSSSFSFAAPSASSPFTTFMFPILLVTAMVFAMVLLQRRQLAGKSGFTTAKAEAAAIPPTRFADVAGAVEAVDELKEAVDIMLRRQDYEARGVTVPRGALLMGPPGTGKTLLARAVAGEAGVPFYSMSGSDFMEMFVGVGAARMRSLFAKARKHEGGAIVFIDEIDTLGRARAGSAERSLGGSHGEQESTLNALLVELDGFHEDARVFVIGATNRPDLLDPALTRSGRLERQVHVGLPDRLGREDILHTHVAKRNITLGASASLTRVASRTPGMSGAELERVVNEASLSMVRDGHTEVSGDDFDAAIALIVMGKPRLSALVTDRDRRITAWHEAGHATAGIVLEEAESPLSVSIIPRGPAGGVTWFEGRDDQFLSRQQAFARLAVAMSGRAAEELLLNGEFTSGPHGDLQAATNLAFAMTTKFGMVDSMLTSTQADMAYTLANDAEVKAAVNALIAEGLERARGVLNEHRDLLEALAEELLARDTLNHEDLARVAARFATPPLSTFVDTVSP